MNARTPLLSSTGIRIALVAAGAAVAATSVGWASAPTSHAPVMPHAPGAPSTPARVQDASAPDATPRRERLGRGLPPPPDWPRAGGFGPLDRGVSEGAAVEGLLGSDAAPRRELTDDDVAAAIEVARRISPEWGETLAERAKGDPAQLRQAMRGGARRLLALSALRERAPEVFEAKIVEIRAQGATAQAAEALAEARDAGGEGGEARLAEARSAFEAAVARQVDASLEVRRSELAALERRIADMRARLASDESRRGELAAELATEIAARAAGTSERRGRGEAAPPPDAR